MPNRMLTTAEVAAYLHLPRPDVERLVREHGIPHHRHGERLTFLRKEIDAWASQRILGLTDAKLRDYHAQTSAKAHDLSSRHAIVTELARPDCFNPTLESRTKASLLRDMTSLADRTGLVMTPTELLASLVEREALFSTALAEGIALLHPRHHDPYMFEDSFIVIGRVSHPLPFGAPDGRRTDLFFLICCQDDRIHLQVLTRVCMMCRNTRLLQGLREAADADAMLAVIRQAERALTERR